MEVFVAGLKLLAFVYGTDLQDTLNLMRFRTCMNYTASSNNMGTRGSIPTYHAGILVLLMFG